MAGFTINGCGAADSYYPLLNVGSFKCSSCGKEQPFALMELKMKIKILYIPTVTVNTKYAVACTKCHEGYYVDESVKNKILNGITSVTVTNDGLKLFEKEIEKLPVEETVDLPENNTSVSETTDSDHEIPKADDCFDETIKVLEKIAEDNAKGTGDSDKSDSKSIDAEYDTPIENDNDTKKNEPDNKKKDMKITPASFHFELPKRIVKQCPKCNMMYASDEETCAFCCCPLEIKE